MDAALFAALGIVVIVAVHVGARRLGVAAPLLLVLGGVLISFVPAVPAIEVEPEWILAGVLPPLLYASAVSMPAMDFRRDFNAIGSLSVVLVVLSSVTLGFFFSWMLPGIGLATGIALGAVASPTDAVATSIVKRLGVPPRLVTVLDGESLLNDASALVILRAAIVATAATVSLWQVAFDFAFAVGVAVAIGAVVGLLNLQARSRMRDATASTAISFVVPFLASVPAEHFGASGLVAAVTAGLVTGQGAARYLRPQDRIATAANWATIELLLEGAVFSLMGLELFGLVEQLDENAGSIELALGVGAGAIVLTLLVRGAYVAPLLWLGQRRAIHPEEAQRRVKQFEERALLSAEQRRATGRKPSRAPRDWSRRVQRYLADVDYIAASPLGRKEGAVLVWAGMRGAITLAAAQSLPRATAQRPLLVLIAFVTAAGSLLLQGGTLGWLVRRLGLRNTQESDSAESEVLADALARAALAVLDDPALLRGNGEPFEEGVLSHVRLMSAQRLREADAPPAADFTEHLHELRLRLIRAQREVLLEARDAGTFSSAALSGALDMLDADQIGTELKFRAGPTGH